MSHDYCVVYLFCSKCLLAWLKLNKYCGHKFNSFWFSSGDTSHVLLQGAITRRCAASWWLWPGRLSRTQASCPAVPARRFRHSALARLVNCSPRTLSSRAQTGTGRWCVLVMRHPTLQWQVPCVFVGVCSCVRVPSCLGGLNFVRSSQFQVLLNG